MERTFEVLLARPPAEVFLWLYEPDKVPRWQSGVEDYEVLGDIAMRTGVRMRQTIEVSGHRRTVEVEVLRADPPRAAETRVMLEGIAVVSAYALAPEAQASTRLRQTVRAKARSFRGRFLLPVVGPHLERKLAADLDRLRDLLA